MPDVNWASLARARRHRRLLSSTHSSCRACSNRCPATAGPSRRGGAHLQRDDAGAAGDRRDARRTGGIRPRASAPRAGDARHRAASSASASICAGSTTGRCSGVRVLVTRPRDQARELVEQLSSRGAMPVEAPLIRILPPTDAEPLRRAAQRAADFDWIVFTSANAVESFMRTLLERASRRTCAGRPSSRGDRHEHCGPPGAASASRSISFPTSSMARAWSRR